MLEETEGVNIFILTSTLIGFAFGLFQIYKLTKVQVGESDKKPQNDRQYLSSIIGRKYRQDVRQTNGSTYVVPVDDGPFFNVWEEVVESLQNIAQAVADGANAFLIAEYKILGLFIVIFSGVIAVLVEEQLGQLWTVGAFILGAFTSVISGYIGMKVAVFANSRTAYAAINRDHGLANAFIVAFRGGSVLGFCLSSLGLLNLLALILLYKYFYLGEEYSNEHIKTMMECIAGYGLGGSTIAMFGRVGGGIYTKAADVGADLAGKVEEGLEEDDPRNPATIADNVGDNVGDIAGMGADLFGSFAEATCAALVVCATSPELIQTTGGILYPLMLSAAGILVCLVTSFFATNIMTVDEMSKIEKTLKYQLIISTVLLTPTLYAISWWVLPEVFHFEIVLPSGEVRSVLEGVTYIHAFICVASGLWSGMIIGAVTEYYTSHSYAPVREVAEASKTGGATNIIYGLALGYLSCIIPTFCLSFTIYLSFHLAGMYGISLAALGMLSNLAISLAIDGYGPIADNAGGMVEMIHLDPSIREKTDALDAAGNTTAAIGKGFAIGSAALVSLALFGAFITRSQQDSVNILNPLEFSGLLLGAMLPYAFSALTMKSVGKAANEMVQEVRRQFQLMKTDPTFQPEYARCVEISTNSSLKEMILPGIMVMMSPIVLGWLFGPKSVAGLLAGILISGVQMAISMANSGGGWDNAKKYIENQRIYAKDDPGFSDLKAAAVTGDTVGDPMKDTSGPSLNILVKLSAITSLIFGGFFAESGGALLSLFGVGAS